MTAPTKTASKAFRLPVVLRQPWLPWALAMLLLIVFGWVLTSNRAARSDELTRFVIELNEGQRVGGTSSVLVTPDGRTIIAVSFIGAGSALVARTLDQLEAKVIPGSTGAARAFLSPDGKWVAYEANGKLRKLPIEGGTPIDLADAEWGGGAWGDDGTIIYSKNYQSGLWQVDEDGGNARKLTDPDSSTRELAHWWPQFLPGGRHVLFTAFRAPISRATIEVLDLKTLKRDTLVEGGVMGRWLSSGHLVFGRDESLLAVAFDPTNRTVSGAPVVVVDEVAMRPQDGFAALDVAPNGTLVFIPPSAAAGRNSLVETDRRGTERAILPTPDRYASPRYAPDQSRISLDITAARSASDVWVLDLARGTRTRITSEEASDFGAVWTPDGRDLIYMSERPLFELYRRAADASRPTEALLTGTHDRLASGVSSDGRLLTFALQVAGRAEIWTVPLQGKPDAKQYLATGFQLGHPVLSPDLQWMAYASDESGRSEVYLQSFPDPTTSRQQVSTNGGSEPVWTRGGKELVYRRGDSIMVAAITAQGRAAAPTALFAGPYMDQTDYTSPRSYDVSPNGERFLLLKYSTNDSRGRMIVTTNWFSELKAKVGQKRN
jgi:serine/threonine-protein kinase